MTYSIAAGPDENKYCGVSISVATADNRKLTQEERIVIRKCLDSVLETITATSMVADPVVTGDREIERKNLLALFGDRMVYAEATPNQYCHQVCCSQRPWYRVTTTEGPMVLGWRKRVIQIEWFSAMAPVAEILFPSEDTTKSGHMIHAHSYKDAARYIETILNTP